MTSDVENLTNLKPKSPGWVEDPSRPVLAFSHDWRAGDMGRSAHSHPRGQLLWAEDGILRVRCCGAHWLVPSSHAVWIRGGIEHEVVMETDLSTRFIYVDPSISRARESRCEVLHMTTLMRHLILRFCQLVESNAVTPRLTNLAEVILDELRTLPNAPLSLPAGTDPRLQRVTSRLIATPDESAGLDELARFSGAGTRTLERLFQRETGLRFSEWRSRLRLMEAVNHLSHGKSSAEIAALLGYRSTSAFVAAFRRNFGVPPQSYLRSGGELEA